MNIQLNDVPFMKNLLVPEIVKVSANYVLINKHKTWVDLGDYVTITSTLHNIGVLTRLELLYIGLADMRRRPPMQQQCIDWNFIIMDILNENKHTIAEEVWKICKIDCLADRLTTDLHVLKARLNAAQVTISILREEGKESEEGEESEEEATPAAAQL